MTALKALTFISTPPNPPHNPTLFRRERLLQRLEEQLQLAKDPSYAPVVKRWKTIEGDVKRPVEHIRRLKPWWRTDEKGFTVLTVRYGFTPIEFEKGKAAIAVGAREKLESVLSTLIAATRSGEMDAVLDALSKRESSKAKKAA